MLDIKVRPRLEINEWSLYHNANVSTRTIILDELELSLSTTATVRDVLQASWQYLQLAETDIKLEGDVTMDDKVVRNGVHLMNDKSLQDYALGLQADLTVIRRICTVGGIPVSFLVVETTDIHVHLGWKILTDRHYDSSTDEDA